MTDYFSETYLVARERFRAAARAAGASTTEHVNPVGLGPDGESLSTDVAWIGDPTASRLLFAVSGTHGVEGYCGSACQLRLLTGGLELPPDTAVLLVHALNPHGFAYSRRVNEDNVDLNRNFVDHANPPANPDYAEVHRWLVPGDWSGPARAEADAALGELAGSRGLRWLQSAVTAGQWTHPDGLFYGGAKRAWSRNVLDEVVAKHVRGRARVGYIDLHTGLGERGVGEPIFRGGRDAGALDRASAWYGPELTRSEDGTSSSTPIIGNTATLVADVLDGDEELTAITLEYGTQPGFEVLAALRADNWLSQSTTAAPEVHDSIKRQIREAFYPSAPDWRDAVIARADVVFAQALRLSTSSSCRLRRRCRASRAPAPKSAPGCR